MSIITMSNPSIRAAAELTQLCRSVVMIADRQRVFTKDRALDLIEELVLLYREHQ